MTTTATSSSGVRAGIGARQMLVRISVALTLTVGLVYVTWRWVDSINWSVWWIAVPLIVAETYSLTDSFLFGATMWRRKVRGEPPPPPDQVTVDVVITTYGEPVEMVLETAVAAKAIQREHATWILDDAGRPDMAAAAEAAGVGYLVRSEDWVGRPRHAKAGNLNNALMALEGEFLLILDADQIPSRKSWTAPWATSRTKGLPLSRLLNGFPMSPILTRSAARHPSSTAPFNRERTAGTRRSSAAPTRCFGEKL